jgi:hypothetical protein
MKDLLTVAKEATNEMKRHYPTSDITPFTEKQLEHIKKIVKDTYLKQSFWWKVKNPFANYKQMILLDIQYNFIGGGVLNPNGDTIIRVD